MKNLGQQFHKMSSDNIEDYRMSSVQGPIRSEYVRKGARTDTYEYRPNPDEVGARLVVRHDEGMTEFQHPVEGHEAYWAKHRYGEDGQIPLFEMSNHAPTSTVDYMAGTKDARIPSMTMMGIAEVETNEEFGRGLSPSKSLSPHSQKLVSHLEDAGATKMPDRISSNDLNFWGRNNLVYRAQPFQPVPEKTVKAGRSRVRSIVKASKKKKTSNVEQPPLPGV